MNTAIKKIDHLKEAGFKEEQAKALVVLFEGKEHAADSGFINKYYLKSQITSLKNEMIMWMVGLLIVVSGFLFMVLNQRITDIKESLEKDIAENRVLIQENKNLIQKILDNQNKFQTSRAE